jgi:hypothetical protein
MALKHIRTKSFRRGLARGNAAQIAVVITGSPSTYKQYTKHEAKKVAESDITIIPIGVGNFDLEEVKSITRNGDGFYQVPAFTELPTLIAEITLETCRGSPIFIIFIAQSLYNVECTFSGIPILSMNLIFFSIYNFI